IANGMAQVIPHNQKLIAFIGDSTLLHTGLQPLINAIKNKTEMTIIVFNNYWTSMTGQQQHAGTPLSLTREQGTEIDANKTEINMLKLLENVGLEKENLIISRAYNIEHLEKIFLDTLPRSGTKVVVINEECALEKNRRLKTSVDQDNNIIKEQTYYKILDSCVKCNECIEYFGCPAINIEILKKESNESDNAITPENYNYFINQTACMPNVCPGLCKDVCRDNMIKKTIFNPNNQKSSSK
ncbi:MAG: thiamine pyrophosphate-dependent enzyme, partial [Candidatus Lokiarchaeota archaeon]